MLFDCFEYFFVARAPTHEIEPTAFTADERQRIARHRWWTIDEIERSNEEFFPRDLPTVIRALTAETHDRHAGNETAAHAHLTVASSTD